MEVAVVSNTVIHYCEKCNKRIPQTEIAKARMLPEGRAVCGGCASSHGFSAPTPKRNSSSERLTPDRGSRSTIPAVQPSRQTGRARSSPDVPARKAPILAIAGVGILLVVGAVAAFWLSASAKPTGGNAPPESAKLQTVASSSPAPGPVTQTRAPIGGTGVPAVVAQSPAATPTVTTPALGSDPSTPAGATAEKREVYDPRGETAKSLLMQAKAFRTANGSDLLGYRERLDYICTSFNGTKAAEEAKVLIETDARLPELPAERNPQPPGTEGWANAVQILPAVDTGKDRVGGWWKMENGRLRSDKAMWAMIGLPYTLPEEYDVRVTFERTDNDDCLLVILSRRGKPFIFSIGSGNKNCSFETIRESRPDILPTKTVKPNLFQNRQRTEVVILVRSQCLRAFLNGKAIVGCQVDDDGLSLHPSLKLPKEGQIGLATWNSVYEFQTLEILPVTGTLTSLR